MTTPARPAGTPVATRPNPVAAQLGLVAAR
jgi:hypothetical protein